MNTTNKWLSNLSLCFLVATAVPAFSQSDPPAGPPQSPQQPTTGWRRFGGTAPGANTPAPAQQVPDRERWNDAQNAPPPPAAAPAPATLVLPAGAWINLRVDQPLASNRNQPGDTFTGTLTQPLVADGRVIARRGQMVVGRVTESSTAGRASGNSKLGLEVIEVSLVDGQQLRLKTQMVQRRGAGSGGDNAAVIGTTTGLGAAVGAAAAGGFGAGMGAIAGAGASIIGVLVSHGKPAVVYPETVLTFRVEQSATISTERAEQAFEQVRPEDYERSAQLREGPPPPRRPSLYGPPPGYFYGGYPYWGPSLYFYSGPGFFYGRYRRW